MKIILIVVSTLLTSILNAQAAHQHPERWYQERWCEQQNGVVEYRLPDRTRVDCLTTTHAVEVDFAAEFYEAIGTDQISVMIFTVVTPV